MKATRRIREYDLSRSILGQSCIIIAILLMLVPQDVCSESPSRTKNTNELYLVIGSIKETKQVIESRSSESDISRNKHGGTITVYAPLFFTQLIFKECDTYVVVDGIAANVPKKKKVVLLADRFFKVKSNDKRHLFFADKYYPREEFIKENNLKDFLILRISKEHWYELEEGTRQFDWELKKMHWGHVSTFDN